MNPIHSTIPSYIASFPKEVADVLNQYYSLIKELAPDAKEGISYGMPGFKLNDKPLVYFGGFKDHTSLFPGGGSYVEAHKEELKEYKTSKGTIQFPLDKPLPLNIIREIIKERVRENKALAK